jgi:hypothetical protein
MENLNVLIALLFFLTRLLYLVILEERIGDLYLKKQEDLFVNFVKLNWWKERIGLSGL